MHLYDWSLATCSHTNEKIVEAEAVVCVDKRDLWSRCFSADKKAAPLDGHPGRAPVNLLTSRVWVWGVTRGIIWHLVQLPAAVKLGLCRGCLRLLWTPVSAGCNCMLQAFNAILIDPCRSLEVSTTLT